MTEHMTNLPVHALQPMFVALNENFRWLNLTAGNASCAQTTITLQKRKVTMGICLLTLDVPEFI